MLDPAILDPAILHPALAMSDHPDNHIRHTIMVPALALILLTPPEPH